MTAAPVHCEPGRRELRAWATRELAAAGCVSARAEADWLLEEAADEGALRRWWPGGRRGSRCST